MVMQEWFERIVGPEYAFPAMVAVAALVALLLLFLLSRIIRHYSAGTYVAGGRNRKTRLAIMDATPVDAHRRLVLVRRDDVEHLLLIGGAADVVVERDIRLSGQARRPAAPSEPLVEASQSAEPAVPIQRPVVPPRPAPTPQPQPRPSSIAAPVSPAPRPAPAPPVMRPAPVAARPASPVKPTMPAAASLEDDFDDELLRELSVELESGKAPPPKTSPVKAPAVSLDDEMTRLLGELSSNKR